jgi:hypothetical protein
MVHLVLAALGAVAGETESLVGHELLAARVDGSAEGNTARNGSAWENGQCSILGTRGGEMERSRACDARNRSGMSYQIKTYPRTIPEYHMTLEIAAHA